MSSPDPSSRTPDPADLFDDLLRRLGECHQNALQELTAKVGKLKKERCLDAQRLEVFYNRNLQLKEQNKTLQDAISLLEERLRAGECDRCAVLGENMKSDQDQNLRLITKLKNERDRLEDENGKLHAEVQNLKMTRSALQQSSSPEHEEDFIPDSPIMPSSLPVANKLKRVRNTYKIKHVRYAEMPLPQSNDSLLTGANKEPVDATKNPDRVEVLVPNTCELDTPPVSGDANLNVEEAVAETCGLELLEPPMRTSSAADQQGGSKNPWEYDVRLKPHRSSPLSALIRSSDSAAERSPSLLPRVKRFSEDASISKAKRKKEESELEVREDDKQGDQDGEDEQKEDKEPELIKRASAHLSSQSIRKPLDVKSEPNQSTFNQRPNVSCRSPVFKNPSGRRAERSPRQELSAPRSQQEAETAERKHKVEPTSTCDGGWRGDEEEQHEELVDTDCTWVSHSLLQGRGGRAWDRSAGVSGLGQKANDSLDVLFDTTAYGEYKSCTGSQIEPCDDEDDDDEGEEEEEDEQDPRENTMSQSKEHRAPHPAFAHVAVVRKKDERRKLKGATCKECEIYYAHLPEEEKQKKLSACSRHRYLYIPPSTPEHFWEVGFPSTQTCIERGYIKEEKNPPQRSRRRQPFTALFSQKGNQQES